MAPTPELSVPVLRLKTALQDGDALIIDVREPSEYRYERVEGVRNIPAGNSPGSWLRFPRTRLFTFFANPASVQKPRPQASPPPGDASIISREAWRPGRAPATRFCAAKARFPSCGKSKSPPAVWLCWEPWLPACAGFQVSWGPDFFSPASPAPA